MRHSANPATYTRGTAIASNAPGSGGGAVVSYSVSPALPVGLSLNPGTGVISGTPTVAAATASYTVTATNTGGSATASVSITVNDAAPFGLTYSANTATYIRGTAIASNTPGNSGGTVVSYSVSPVLPAGLSLNPGTGVISGTPAAITARANYTVTATNATGSTTRAVSIAVNDVAPSSLTYSTNPATYTVGTAIASNTPGSGGGAVVSYSVSPALPPGLSLDTSTGVISGTPAVAAATASYTVTATNTGGPTTAAVSITVNDVAPSLLTYSGNPATYTVGTEIAYNTPGSSGGAVVSYSVSPVLPEGLSLNTSTGVISGTPSVVAATASYTVTATNSGGSTTTAVSITVSLNGPLTAIYTTGNEVPRTANGYNAAGNTVNFTLNYAPAAGTQLMVVKNTGTGFISGTFSNLAQGQAVVLSYNGVTYNFVANYYGGTGNDLVLVWKGTRAFAWGDNSAGQLGNNSTTTSRVPVAMDQTGVLAGKTVVTVAAGFWHSLALCSDGTVAAWGWNDYGQLGNNSTTDSPVPVAVTNSGVLAGKTVVAVAAGDRHSLALCSDGTVAAWGSNSDGRLGNNSGADSLVPVAVDRSGVLAGKTVVAIAAGYLHSVALCSDGTVAAWGGVAPASLETIMRAGRLARCRWR